MPEASDVDGHKRPALAAASRWALALRMPTLFASVLLCGLALFLSWHRESPTAGYISLPIAIAGFHIRGWSLLYMGSRNNGRTAILTRGPFRFVRHPRYLGSLLILTAFLVMIGSSRYWLSLMALVVSAVTHMLAAHKETLDLLARGPLAHEYVKNVPAMFPIVSAAVLLNTTDDDDIVWSNISMRFVRKHVSVFIAVGIVYTLLLFRTVL
jgi:protein-S-isoprenylcysteine O-methyltransferase Ste14